MSADLFAEFSDFSARAPQSIQDQPLTLSAAQAQTPARTQHLVNLEQSRSDSKSASQPFPNWGLSQSRFRESGAWPAFSQLAQPGHDAAVDDDDGWGDFEVADLTPPSTITRGHPSPGHKTQQKVPSQNISSAPTVDLVPLSHLSNENQLPNPRPKTHWKAGPSDPSVLFDADDFELSGAEAEDDEVDEFGDFATAAQPSPPPLAVTASTAALAPSVDLLGIEDISQICAQESVATSNKPLKAFSFRASSSSHTQPSQVPSTRTRDLLSDSSEKSGSNTKNTQIDVSSAAAAEGSRIIKNDDDDDDDDDGWGLWDDISDANTHAKSATDGLQPPDNWDWNVLDNDSPTALKPSDDNPPPINVPPPWVILSVFPDLINSGSSLLQSIAGQNKCVKEQVLSDPRAVQFLRSYTLLGITAARIIADRKHRWHRDRMLAKSMSISAAGSKGMKLAGVDKTQAAREDREAADVVAAWREHVGRLRAAIVTANASGKANIRVPELGENMQIQTAKMVPTARGPCLICGLKREERISRVDLDVEDSFGEWWTEHWGHRTCRNFWLEHEQRLRQR